MSQSKTIHFTCPDCRSSHDRGYIDGVKTFRCARCWYIGTENAYGAEPDPPPPPPPEPFEAPCDCMKEVDECLAKHNTRLLLADDGRLLISTKRIRNLRDGGVPLPISPKFCPFCGTELSLCQEPVRRKERRCLC